MPSLSPAWDRRSPASLTRQRDRLVGAQLRHVVAPASPYYRERVEALGLRPATVRPRDLQRIAPAGERDVCPDGDPAAAAALVVQGSEAGYALHADGPALRRALRRRLLAPAGYRAQLERDARPVAFATTGLGLRFPLASTRADLDVLARAGARLARVAGLGRDDVVLDAWGLEPNAERQALDVGLLGAGVPHLVSGPDPEALARAGRLVATTALVVAAGAAPEALAALEDGGADLAALRTLLLVGAPTDAERAAAEQALRAAGGAADAVVLGLHAPSGARLLWAECRESVRGRRSSGYHAYPDLDLIEAADPETGEPLGSQEGPAELLLTQLGLGGSALVRWRTGDLVDRAPADGPCAGCGRRLPLVPTTVRRGALVPSLDGTPLDLRPVTAALEGRPEVADWRVVLRRGARSGEQLVVHVRLVGDADEARAAVDIARDVRAGAGRLPGQVVVTAADEQLPAPTGVVLGRRTSDQRYA